MSKLILTEDQRNVLSEIVNHIISITKEEDGVWVADYQNLMLRFPEYDWQILNEIKAKL